MLMRKSSLTIPLVAMSAILLIVFFAVAQNGVITKMGPRETFGYVGTETNHDLRLFTHNLPIMSLTTGGNVGIGTTSPVTTLDVAGTVKAIAFDLNGDVITSWPSGDGGGITQLDAGTGITLSPNPIMTTGTVSVATSGITDAMLAGSISPSKISGTAWTSTNDGPGSGLNADELDGLDSSAFLNTSNDHGRLGVATDLYEGSTKLQDKYLNNNQPETITASISSPGQTLRVVNNDNGHGIYGESFAFRSEVGGVTGRAKRDGGSGVYGETFSLGKDDATGRGSSVAVYGWAVGQGAAVGGAAIGVLGKVSSYQPSGVQVSMPTGVYGWAEAKTGMSAGVLGEANSSDGPSPGVYGVNKATTGSTRGVWGEVKSPNGVGVFGINESGSAGTKGGYFQNGHGTYAHIAYWDGTKEYGILSNGVKSTIMPTSNGNRVLVCTESPEAWFEDFGEGQLVNGHAHIELDPLFLETVTINSQHPMKVFIQLNDDCNGVFAKRGNTGFDVIELQKGQSNANFTYRVVAKRKGFEEQRLERLE